MRHASRVTRCASRVARHAQDRAAFGRLARARRPLILVLQPRSAVCHSARRRRSSTQRGRGSPLTGCVSQRPRPACRSKGQPMRDAALPHSCRGLPRPPAQTRAAERDAPAQRATCQPARPPPCSVRAAPCSQRGAWVSDKTAGGQRQGPARRGLAGLVAGGGTVSARSPAQLLRQPRSAWAPPPLAAGAGLQAAGPAGGTRVRPRSGADPPPQLTAATYVAARAHRDSTGTHCSDARWIVARKGARRAGHVMKLPGARRVRRELCVPSACKAPRFGRRHVPHHPCVPSAC